LCKREAAGLGGFLFFDAHGRPNEICHQTDKSVRWRTPGARVGEEIFPTRLEGYCHKVGERPVGIKSLKSETSVLTCLYLGKHPCLFS